MNVNLGAVWTPTDQGIRDESPTDEEIRDELNAVRECRDSYYLYDDQVIEKEVRAVVGYGNVVSVGGEWPADDCRRQELLDDIRETLSRMCDQGRGDGFSFGSSRNSVEGFDKFSYS
ncbi:hypothetical protein [Pandoraea oxalativorans]|uniref:Uncharacterized protein n=1 Tax=Pandoraea oxalativorans TaxID=573737 RepID=A0A0G3ICZ9_9BURK|nr:hypothetical protein [Pandoraea oxalativorans]AKK23905.1 hypothetical protein MB84_25635 [Pandoraea oxalativorans]